MPSRLEKRKLDKFRSGFVAAADRGVKKTADDVKEERDDLVHEISGDLKESGRVVPVETLHWEVREGEDLPDARASYEEYGTDKHDPHPHMTPAAENNRPNLPKNIKREIRGLL